MATGVLIRTFSPTDSVGALTKLLHEAFAPLGKVGFNYTAVDQTEEVTRERMSLGECLVAVDNGTIIGTLTLHAPGTFDDAPYYKQPSVAAVCQVGVSPKYQGQGVGGLLFREAERLARQVGAVELALDTSEGAHHLIAWYERQGYRIVEHLQLHNKTYRSVVLAKMLPEG